MKKNLILIFFLLLSAADVCEIFAQNVTVNAEIDSFQRFVGEQAKITLEVIVDADKKVLLPDFDKELIEGVEIVQRTLPDTSFLNDKKRMEITETYTVTSFDSSLYVIPPFEVFVDGKPYYSKELAMAVYTIPLDTLNPEAFFGPKDVWKVQLSWEDYKDSVYFFMGVLLFSLALIWVLIRYLSNKPIIRIVKIKPKLPPHVVAINEMERIKNDGKWRVSGHDKEYYTALTDAIRVYLNDRFGFNATEMTTGEIVDNLLNVSDKETIKELEELLVVADLVKFAKFQPPMNENDRNIVNAIEFVNRTKQNETDENPQPLEKKIVNKRSLRSKRILLLTVILLSVAVLFLFVMFVRELYYLLS